MANGQSRFAGPARAAALGLWLGAVGVALIAPPALAEDKKQTVSADIAKKLKPAQEALQKNDFDTGMALAKEALAIATKPYDKEMSLRMIQFAAGKKQDYATYADTLEQLNQLDTVPAEDKAKSYKPLAQIYAQQHTYDKAAQYATQWAQAGGGADAYGLLANIYLIQKDCKNGVAALEHAVEGREASESELKQQNYCYYQLGDKPKRQAVMEQLVARFLKREYLYDLVLIYQEQKIDDRALLSLYRLSFDKDFMTRESEFVEYADMALNAGAPAEALQVLNQGVAKGAVKLIAPSDHNSRSLAQAKAQAAEDRKQIPQLDKEARAGKNGEADVKVGLAYLGLGDYPKVVESIERGLSAERAARVKRADDANMMLGIAYAKLGKKDEATKAFTAAKGDPRMVKAATIWLGTL
jgi:lipopolysaccharide biosynthesis regulator YciM